MPSLEPVTGGRVQEDQCRCDLSYTRSGASPQGKRLGPPSLESQETQIETWVVRRVETWIFYQGNIRQWEFYAGRNSRCWGGSTLNIRFLQTSAHDFWDHMATIPPLFLFSCAPWRHPSAHTKWSWSSVPVPWLVFSGPSGWTCFPFTHSILFHSVIAHIPSSAGADYSRGPPVTSSWISK